MYIKLIIYYLPPISPLGFFYFQLEDKPRADFTPHKPSSPGPSESSTDRKEALILPVSDSSPPTKPGMPSSLPLPHSTCNSTVAAEQEELSTVFTAVARSPIPVEEKSLPEADSSPTASSPSPGKAVNGLSESPPPSPICEQVTLVQEFPLTSTQSSALAPREAPVSGEEIQAEPTAPVTQSISPTTSIPSNTMAPTAPPPGLPVLIQPHCSDVLDQGKGSDVRLKAESTTLSSDSVSETHNQTNSRKITAAGRTRFLYWFEVPLYR